MYRAIILSILLSSCAAGYGSSTAPQQMANASMPDEYIEEVDSDDFDRWIADFKNRALKSGISKKSLDSSLKIAEPIERVIELDRKQPERSKITKEEYLAKVIDQNRINKGRQLLDDNREVLNKISARYGVEPEFIVALWGLETGYGKNTGGFGIISSLATLAYEGRRREFFESELISALLIIDSGHITAKDMRGSWAGAMGQCQFMPSSFLAYAVDHDGDGKKDIWGNRQDVFASIANYLNTVGWGANPATKEKALMHWNRSTYFVASVFKLAEEIKNES